MKKTIIWIALIDSHEIKIFQTSKEEKEMPSLVKSIVLETEPNPKRTSVFDSQGGGRHGVEPHSDFKLVERQHLAVSAEKFLHESLNEEKFHNLILISPHKMFSVLEDKLSEQVQQKITHKLHKNMGEFSPKEIKEYLLEAGI